MTLSVLTGVAIVPAILVSAMQNGQRVEASSDVLDVKSPPLLVSIQGYPETVAVQSMDGVVFVEMSARRSDLEYALGLATAIALLRSGKVELEHGWLFFSSESTVDPSTLLQKLKARQDHSDLIAGARALRAHFTSGTAD